MREILRTLVSTAVVAPKALVASTQVRETHSRTVTIRSNIRRLMATGTLVASLFLVSAPASAAPPPGPGGGETTGADLEHRGFSCGRIGIGGYMCTKPGEKTWYCDNSGRNCHSELVRPGWPRHPWQPAPLPRPLDPVHRSPTD
jgi:hypothetical protein